MLLSSNLWLVCTNHASSRCCHKHAWRCELVAITAPPALFTAAVDSMNDDVIAYLEEWKNDISTTVRMKQNLTKAMSGLRVHPSTITTLEEALAVPYIGEYIGTKIVAFRLEHPAEATSCAQGAHSQRRAGTRVTGRQNAAGSLDELRVPPSRGAVVEDSDEDSELLEGETREGAVRSGIGQSSVNASVRPNRGRGGALRHEFDDDDDDDDDDDGLSPLYGGNRRARGRGGGQVRGNGRGRGRGHGRGLGRGHGGAENPDAPVGKGSAVAAPRTIGRGRGRGRGGTVSNLPEDYDPRYRSGPHAMMVALWRAHQSGRDYLTKKDLIHEATPLADEPLEPVASASTSVRARYSGWSSMSRTLIKKGLVSKSGSPARYGLTAVGMRVAQRASARDSAALEITSHLYDPAVQSALPFLQRAAPREQPPRRPLDVGSLPASAVADAAARVRNIHKDTMTVQHLSGEWGNASAVRSAATHPSSSMPSGSASRSTAGNPASLDTSALLAPAGVTGHAYEEVAPVRSEREIERAHLAASVLVGEGYDAATVCDRVRAYFGSEGDIPRGAEQFCDLLRRNLLKVDAGVRTGLSSFKSGLVLSGLASSLRRDQKARHPAVIGSTECGLETMNSAVVSGARIEPTATAFNGDTRLLQRAAELPTGRPKKRPRTASAWIAMATSEVLNLVLSGYSVDSCVAALHDVTACHETESSEVLRARLEHSLTDGAVALPVGNESSGKHAQGETSTSCATCGHKVRNNAIAVHEARCGRLGAGGRDVGEPFRRFPRVVADEKLDARASAEAASVRNRVDGGMSEVITAPEAPSGLAQPSPANVTVIDEQSLALRSTGAEAVVNIVLLVDNREIHGNGGSHAVFVRELENAMISAKMQIEKRLLPVGDALFIAVLPDKTEVVLDWIVERKTLPDLISSVMDGRLKHQVYAMNSCGLSNKMLLLEGHLSDFDALAEDSEMSSEDLEATLSDLSLCDGFFVNRTKNVRETTDAFVHMRGRLEARFAWMDPVSVSRGRLRYSAWSDRALASSRRMTLKQLFSLQLCSVAGIGELGAARVVSRGIDTPAKLHNAYRRDCGGVPERMDDLLRNGLQPGERALNATSSSCIRKVYTFSNYETTLCE